MVKGFTINITLEYRTDKKYVHTLCVKNSRKSVKHWKCAPRFIYSLFVGIILGHVHNLRSIILRKNKSMTHLKTEWFVFL